MSVVRVRHTPHFLMTDPAEVARLIRANPWATFVSGTSNGLVASHYPALLDESAEDLTVASHFGRPDEQLHELGEHEVLVIVQARTPLSRPAGIPRARTSRPGTT